MAVQGSFVRFAIVLCAYSTLAQLQAEGRSIPKDFAQPIEGVVNAEGALNAPDYGSQSLLRRKRQAEQGHLRLPNPFAVDQTTDKSDNVGPGSPTGAIGVQQPGGVQPASTKSVFVGQSKTSQVLLNENSSQTAAGPGSPTGATEKQPAGGQRASQNPFLEGQSKTSETGQVSVIQSSNQDQVALGSTTGALTEKPAELQPAIANQVLEGQSQTRETSQVLVAQNSNQEKVGPGNAIVALGGQAGDLQTASQTPVLEGQSQTRETSQVTLTENSNQEKVGLGSPAGGLGGQPTDLQSASSNQLLEGQSQARETSQVLVTQNSNQEKVGLASPTGVPVGQPADVQRASTNPFVEGQSQTRDTSQVLLTQNSNQENVGLSSLTGGLGRQPADVQTASSNPVLEGQSQTRETSQVVVTQSTNQEKIGLSNPIGVSEGQLTDVQRASSTPPLEGQIQTRETSQLSSIQNSDSNQDKVPLQIPLDQAQERIVGQQLEVERAQQNGLSNEQTRITGGSENTVGQLTQSLPLEKADLSGGQQKIVAEQGSGQVRVTESSSVQRQVGQTDSLTGDTTSDVLNVGQVRESGAETGQLRISQSTQSSVPSQQLSEGALVEMLNRGSLKEGENRNTAQSDSGQVKVTELSSVQSKVDGIGSIGAGTSEVSNSGQASVVDRATGQLRISESAQSKLSLQELAGANEAASLTSDLTNGGQKKIIAENESSQVKIAELPSGLGEMAQRSIGAGSLSETSALRQASQGGSSTGQLRISESAQSKVQLEQFPTGSGDLLNVGQKIISQRGSSQVKLPEYPRGLGESAQSGTFGASTMRAVSNMAQASQSSSSARQVQIGENTQSKILMQQVSLGNRATSINRNFENEREKNFAALGSSQIKLDEYPRGLGELSQKDSFGAGLITKNSNMGLASEDSSATTQLRIRDSSQSKVTTQQYSGRRDAGSFGRHRLNARISRRPLIGTIISKRRQGLNSVVGSEIGQLRIGDNTRSKITVENFSGGNDDGLFGGGLLSGATPTRPRQSIRIQQIRRDFENELQAGRKRDSVNRALLQRSQVRVLNIRKPIDGASFNADDMISNDSSHGVSSIRKVVQVTRSQQSPNSFVGGPSRRVIIRIKKVRKTYSDQSPGETTQRLGGLRILVHRKTLGQNLGSSTLLSGGANTGESILLAGPSSDSGTSRVIVTQQGGTDGGSGQGGRSWKVKVFRYRVQKGGKTMTGHKTITTVHSKPTIISRKWSWSSGGSSLGFPDITTSLGGLQMGGTALGGGFTTSHGGLSHSGIVMHSSGITSGLHGGAGDLLSSVGGIGGFSSSSSHQFSQSMSLRRK